MCHMKINKTQIGMVVPSLTMVLNYWGLNITQAEVTSNVYDKTANTTYTNKMSSYPQTIGFNPVAINGSILFLKQFTDAGFPLIVLQNATISTSITHYRVVIGYDDSKNWIVTDDPYYGSNYNITYSAR